MFSSINPLGPFAYVVLAILMIPIVRNIRKIVKGPEYTRIVGSLELLVVTYPLGVILKITLIGPDFVRWHLADLGFVPALAAILVGPAWLTNKRKLKSELVSERINFRCRFTRVYRVFLFIAAALAIAYEYIAGWGVTVLRARGEADGIHIGAFDGIDVVFYLVGGSLALYLATKLIQLLELELTSALQAEKALAKAAKRQRRRSPRR